MTKLAHCLNTPILVSIPSLFGNDAHQSCRLIDIEPSGSGLWLESESFVDLLRKADETVSALPTLTVFVPFSQIVSVLNPAQFAILAQKGAAPVVPRQTTQPRQKAEGAEGNNRTHDHRSKHKNAKPRRVARG
jgi:hypothetical protein